MFLDAMNHCGLEFGFLDPGVMYSFVLQHPENRIVIPIISPKIYLVAAYKIYKNAGPTFIKCINIQPHFYKIYKCVGANDANHSCFWCWAFIKFINFTNMRFHFYKFYKYEVSLLQKWNPYDPPYL